MKIKKVRIENFRSFRDQEFKLNRYSCFVGPNGAGKSTVLCALNVFFREQDSSATDTTKLCDEDFFRGQTDTAIRITVTFDELGDLAIEELGAYVRNNELVVTAEATFDEQSNIGQVRHIGQRLGMTVFRPFFDAMKAGASAAKLTEIFDEIRAGFPTLPNARSKDDKAAALRDYESQHLELCELIPSEDQFYGINGTGKLAPFVQWIYVPAVKDAMTEAQESKNSAFGKLIARTVRSQTNFEAELQDLKRDTLAKYSQLLEKNRAGLEAITESLQKRLEAWAHPNARVGMDWLFDPNKSIQVAQPIVALKTGDGDFLGSLARMGHGLQRSYLLALLHELCSSDSQNAPTLILACEEPELYQHPPQARHLADVLSKLSCGNNQVLVTTHSPLFVSGDGFENIRLVRAPAKSEGSTVSCLTFDNLCTRIRQIRGEVQKQKNEGLVAKIHQSLRPHIAEMFFTRIPIFVEGLEDASYLTTALHLFDMWSDFRRQGCHIIPVNGKDKLIEPIAITQVLKIPFFAMFDADGDITNPKFKTMHERDNIALLKLFGIESPAFPTETICGENLTVWATNLTKAVEDDFAGNCQRYKEAARLNYAQEGGLEKNDLFIAEWLTLAHGEGFVSNSLFTLCNAILQYSARS
jgi:putative ATP-dependent endonuclease of OLD family